MIRSLVFIPGHKISYFDKIKKNLPDAVCFDLEDSVPKNKKKIAKIKISNFLKNRSNLKLKVFIRLDNYIEPVFMEFYNLIYNNVYSVIIPKVSEISQIIKVEKILKKIEKKKKIKNKIKISLLIENLKGIYNLEKMIHSTKRIDTIIYGEEDFLNDIEYFSFNSEPKIDFYRNLITFIAKKNSLKVIYTPYLYIKNILGLKKHINLSKKFGFTGLLIVHPSQINIANKLYLPSKQDYLTSLKILNMKKSLKYEGQNILVSKGKLLGPPMIKRAKKIIEFYEKFKQSN